MFANWFSALAGSILMMSCSQMIQSDPVQKPRMRDLSRYDRGGPYALELGLDAQTRANREAEVREFLWNHWHQRGLGYVTVTQYSKEGEPSTSSYFVEPDEKGVWQIAIKIDRMLVDRDGTKSQHYESVEYDAHFVERIEVPKDRLTQNVVIPEGKIRAPQSYRLALKDEKGKTLTKI